MCPAFEPYCADVIPSIMYRDAKVSSEVTNCISLGEQKKVLASDDADSGEIYKWLNQS